MRGRAVSERGRTMSVGEREGRVWFVLSPYLSSHTHTIHYSLSQTEEEHQVSASSAHISHSIRRTTCILALAHEGYAFALFPSPSLTHAHRALNGETSFPEQVTPSLSEQRTPSPLSSFFT